MSSYKNPAHESVWVTRVVLFVAVLALIAASATAQDNAKCLECHGVAGLSMDRDGHKVSLFVDADKFKTSVHKSFDCVACHSDLSGAETFPHEKNLARVDCTQCHEDRKSVV
jgi:nitrate reductase cytochrome c-type subunit